MAAVEEPLTISVVVTPSLVKDNEPEAAKRLLGESAYEAALELLNRKDGRNG